MEFSPSLTLQSSRNQFSDSSLPPSQRTDKETSIELKCHPDLWFSDGSVVCRAENTLFRVHMSQLARHSVCFRDMFSIPQPHGNASVTDVSTSLSLRTTAGGPETYESCPVVHLHDRAEDVANLLTALYDGPNFGNNDQHDFIVVSGILRLATKYIIESLRAKALVHLSIAWPSTLKGWDAREDCARAYELEVGGRLYPSPLAVIQLAREVDAPSLLPAAFYDLSRYAYTQIFEPNEDEPLYHPATSSIPPPTLSGPDVQRLALGKEAVQQTITTLIQAMGQSQYIRHPSTHVRKSSGGGVCVSAAACRKDFSELVDLATQHYLFDRERGCYDPLYVAEELGQLKSAEFSECKACAKSLENWAAKERHRLWKMIPSWFRLETADAEGGKSG